MVLGPEAPLIAIGSGLGVLAIHLVKNDAPPMAAVVIGAAGSFAAIATLLGSPLVGAFLLMEMAGLGGPTMEIVLVPGLLAAGVGSLIFVGLNSLTGFGAFSLTVTSIPHVGSPTVGEFLWAFVIGVVSAVVATAIFRLATILRPLVERSRVLFTPVAGVAVAGLAIAFAAGTGRSSSEVLFSGQSALPALVQQAAGWTVGALLLLLLCKGLAYSISLSGFRGGPIFPSMFIGAAGGIALSHAGGHADDRRCRHGRRGDDRRGAEDAHDGRVVAEPPLPLRRRRPDAGCHRGRGGGVCRHHLDQTEPGRGRCTGAGAGTGARPGSLGNG